MKPSRKNKPDLSVCCLTAAPLKRMAAILSLLREVADEIVCAVDSRVPEHELLVFDRQVDILKRFEFDPTEASIERQLAWLHSLCSGRWILRLDNDEVPSLGLIKEIPTLVKATDILQYNIQRLWLFPDADHYIDERPWTSDWQVRLVRNERIALRFAGGLHTNIFPVEPLRFVDLPLYHLDLAINSREAREAKVEKYEGASPGLESEIMPGRSVNSHYLPERFQICPSSPVPEEDVQLIAKVMAGTVDRPRRRKILRRRAGRVVTSQTATASLGEIDHAWPLRQVSAEA